jgi:hypothetical protein
MYLTLGLLLYTYVKLPNVGGERSSMDIFAMYTAIDRSCSQRLQPLPWDRLLRKWNYYNTLRADELY